MNSLSRCVIAKLMMPAFCCLAIQSTLADPPAVKLSVADRIKQIKANAQATAQNPVSPAIAQNPVYAKVINGTVFIGTTGESGDSWQGTGWVLDLDQRLVVTNHHVIDSAEECAVFFPLYANDQLVSDLGTTLTPDRAIKGRVVDSDKSCDLALIQLDSMPNGAIALPLAERSAAPGQRIHSIAGNTVGSQSLWTYSTGYVRQILQGQLANGGACLMLESDMATNQGNSGGPVCDDEGRVVAVVEGHSTEARLVSMYIDLQALTHYLDESLRCVDPKSQEDLQFAIVRQLSEKRPNAALALATKAVSEDSKSALNLALRGQCWLALEDWDSAAGDFSDALKQNPQLASAHAGLGELAAINDEYEESIKHFSNAIRNDSSNLEHLVGRGHVRLKFEEYEDALKDFNAALRRDASSVNAARGKAFALINLGEYDAGGEALVNVLDHFQDDAESFYMVGRSLIGLELHENANVFLKKAIELNPAHAQAHYDLGENLILDQQFAAALPSLEIALDEWKDDARTNYLYGVALFGNGDIDNAITYLDKATELDPDDEEISAGIAELKQAVVDAAEAAE